QEGEAVPGKYFIFHNLRVPLIAMFQEWTDVVFGLHLVPIDVGVSAKNTHLMPATTVHVRLSHGLVQLSVNRRRVAQTEGVAPRPQYIFDRNRFTSNVSIHGLLIKRISELHHDVVNTVGELWAGD